MLEQAERIPCRFLNWSVVTWTIGLLAGVLLVLPAPFGGWTVNPGDLTWFRWPFAPDPPLGLDHPSLALASDWVDVFGPDQAWMAAQVRAGYLPLWNDMVFGGWPQFASQQTGVLSPFTWLTILTATQGTTLAIVAKVATALAGTCFFARALGMSRAGSLLAAIAFATGTYFLDWIFHPHTAAYAWMPWSLLGLLRLVSPSGSPRHFLLTAAAMALMWSSGHPQSAFICSMFCGVFAIAAIWHWRPSSRRVALTALAMSGGCLTAMVQLLPFLDMFDAAYSRSRGGHVGAPLVSWLGLVVPDWWGTPDNPPLEGHAGAAMPNYFERTVYLGVPSLLLAIVATIYAKHWIKPFLLSTLIVCSVYVADLGTISRLAIDAPVLNSISMPRLMIVVAFTVSLLAGFGYDTVRTAPRRTTVILAVSIVALCGLLLFLRPHLPPGAFPSVAWPFSGSSDATTAASQAFTRFTGLALGTFAIVALIVRRSHLRRHLPLLLVTLTGVELIAHGRALLPHQTIDRAYPPATPAIKELARLQADSRVVAGPLPTLHPNVASRFGVRDLRGRGLPVPRRTVAAWEALGQPADDNLALFDPESPQVERFLAFGGVQALLTPAPVNIPGTKATYIGTDGFVYAVAEPTHRATLVSTWVPVADEAEATKVLSSADLETLRNAAIIETERKPHVASTTARPAQIAIAGTNRVAINLPPHSGGFLLLRDTYASGWHAKVDGRPARIVPANVSQRAVEVPPGARTVEFRYWPRSLSIGAVISVAAALVVGLTAWLWRRRRLGAVEDSMRFEPPTRAKDSIHHVAAADRCKPMEQPAPSPHSSEWPENAARRLRTRLVRDEDCHRQQ